MGNDEILYVKCSIRLNTYEQITLVRKKSVTTTT